VLYLGAVNLARARLALDGESFVATLPLAMPPAYLAASGLVWGIAFIVAALGVWRLWSWARKLVLSAIRVGGILVPERTKSPLPFKVSTIRIKTPRFLHPHFVEKFLYQLGKCVLRKDKFCLDFSMQLADYI
jgi:hypothetical protein